jgi:hypothetical protein
MKYWFSVKPFLARCKPICLTRQAYKLEQKLHPLIYVFVFVVLIFGIEAAIKVYVFYGNDASVFPINTVCQISVLNYIDNTHPNLIGLYRQVFFRSEARFCIHSRSALQRGFFKHVYVFCITWTAGICNCFENAIHIQRVGRRLPHFQNLTYYLGWKWLKVFNGIIIIATVIGLSLNANLGSVISK